MVTGGTGHDRCPSQFSGPIWRPEAILRWRLKNKKPDFGFKGVNDFFEPQVSPGTSGRNP
jgi:hypothetical protein